MGDVEFYTYVPEWGHQLEHDPFNAIVGPRPIGWISSVDTVGRVNLAPYSFFNAFNYIPPIIGFSSVGWKDTVANIQATGEFVWNLVDYALAERMNITAASVAHDVCEFDLARLRQLPSDFVKPPRVADSPVHFECRLTQILQLRTAAGEPVESWMIFGEVIGVHIRRDLVKTGSYDTAAARPILRAGGAGGYATIHPENMFEMLRPRDPNTVEQLVRSMTSSSDPD